MCKIHRIHCSINTLKNSINKITEFIVISRKLENATVCVSFFCRVYYRCSDNRCSDNRYSFDVLVIDCPIIDVNDNV